MSFAYRLVAFVCLALLAVAALAADEVKFTNPGTIRLTADFGEPFQQDLRALLTQPGVTGIAWSASSDLPSWLTLDKSAGTLSGNPPLSAVGVKAFRVSAVKSEAGDINHPFEIEVRALPKWDVSPLDLGTAREDFLFTFELKGHVVNPLGGMTVFSASGLPAWLSLDAATGTLSGTPRRADVGPFGGITFTVTTSGGTATVPAHGLVLKTIHPPHWKKSPIALEGATDDSAYSRNVAEFAVNAEGTPLSYTKLSGPAWATVDPDGTIHGSPSKADVGSASVGVRLSTSIDGQQYQDDAVFTIVVTHVKKPPVWSISDVDLGKAKEDGTFSFDLKTVVTDPEGGAITFSATGLPAWLTLSPAGIFSGTPRRKDVGPFSGIQITATASGGSASAAAHGEVLKTIHPPKWTANPITLADGKEDVPYLRDASALVSNPEGTALTFEKVSGAAWLTLSATGLLSGTPRKPDVGPAAIVARFTTIIDGQTYQDTTTLQLTVIHVKKPPVWSVPDVDLGKAREDAAFSFDLKAVVTDPEGGAITFSATGLPAWLTLSPAGIFSGTPRRKDVGPFSGIQITATASGGSASAAAHGEVLKTIHPPKWTANPIALADGKEDVAYLKDVTPFVSSPEGTPLAFEKISGPAWLSVLPTGLLSGTPHRPDAGPVQLVVKLSTTIDGNAYDDTTTFLFTVKKAIHPPKWISDPVVLADAPDGAAYLQELSKYVLNPEGTALTYDLASSPLPPAWLAVQASTGLLFGVPQKENVGAVSVRAHFTTIIDGQSYEDTTTVQLKVTHVGKPPRWNEDPINLGVQPEGKAFTFDLRPKVTDPEGGNLVFTAAGLPAWLKLDPAGTLSGTPRREDVGKYADIVFTVTAVGGSAMAKGFGEVIKVLQPPRWVASSLRLDDAKEDMPYSKALLGYVLNPENMPLAFDLSPTAMPPAWVSLGAATAMLTGTPHAAAIGPVSLKARLVAVYQGQTYEDTTTLLFDVLAKGKPPVWGTNPIHLTATAERPFSASLAPFASDPAGLALDFTRLTGPGWLAVAGNGALAGTPALADVGDETWRVRVCNTLPLCADATLVITVKKEPPTQTDTVQIDADVPNAVVENLWVIGNNASASHLMCGLKEKIHVYYEDLAGANVWSSGVLISADGGRKGEPVREKNGPWLLLPGAGIVADFQKRVDLAFTPGLFTKRFNSPIWSMFMLYSRLPTLTEIYHNGWFQPGTPMETLIVTANRDHYLCYAKKTPQEGWDANDYANAFIDVHRKEGKPYRISVMSPEVPSNFETTCSASTATSDSTYDVLVHKTDGKTYAVNCADMAAIEAAMHDYARESIFRARVAAHAKIPLTKKPEAGTIHVTIAGVEITGGEKWTYDAEENAIVVHWELIDDVKLEPGDKIVVRYRVAGYAP